MTHTPPVPAGNQSPYPLHEAPHKHASPTPPVDDRHVARTPEARTLSAPTLVALAAGVAAAVAGGLFYALGSDKPKKRRKRRASKEG
jgi:hypothetical protein